MIRRVVVYVDGTVVARIREGSVATIDPPPGVHTVSARMDWVRSRPISIRTQHDHDTRVVISLNYRVFAQSFEFVLDVEPVSDRLADGAVV